MTLNYSDETTLNLGNKNAAHELTVISNLGCPHCKEWHSINHDAVEENLKNGSLQIHYKFWNKEKPSLKNGGFAHRYIDYSNVDDALDYVNRAYDHQEEINDTNYDELSHFIETTLKENQHVSDEVIDKINKDVLEIGYLPLPTILLDNEIVGNTEYKLPIFK